MKISIASDHAGHELKSSIIDWFKLNQQYEIIDRGCKDTTSCDYPDFGHLVAKDVSEGQSQFGIVICGTGNGINMTVNKWSKIRSALCWNNEIAQLARQHNDANILALPARFIDEEMAIECVLDFINTEFEGGRHANRIQKISVN
jgi:ribose 5-phosphate isomerase B